MRTPLAAASVRASTLGALIAIAAIPAAAETTELAIDPTGSSVTFALGAFMHTVHGEFPVERGSI